MYPVESTSKKRAAWLWVALAALVLFHIAFWPEVRSILIFVWEIIKTIIGLPGGVLPTDLGHSLVVLLFNYLVGFVAVFLLWLFLVSSQALLPINNFKDASRAAWHLFLYISGQHGPAIFIKDGKQLATAEDMRRSGPGVMVIDFNSAVVLEEQLPAPGLSDFLPNIVFQLSIRPGLMDAFQSPRVCGRGIVFTRPRERIRGVVDLRKQTRSRSNIRGYTRDGIEVSTNIWALFTIGQKSETLQVSYHGDHRIENLRIVAPEKLADGTIRIKFSDDHIDEADQREIHQFARVVDRIKGALSTYQDLKRTPPVPDFDEKRVFAAVFSEARDSQELVRTWDDLPVQVGIDIFREMLSHYNYDQLFQPEKNPDFPLSELKRLFRGAVRNQGTLNYRYIGHRDGIALSDKQVYRPEELVKTEELMLTSPHVLRNRGIKILACGFGDLIPVSEAVYKQRLDNWRAKWERDTDIIRATNDLEAMRIRTRARTLAQKDMVNTFSKLFQNNKYSQEALSLRLLQALETLVSDPKTKDLLPQDTLKMMQNLHEWVHPREEKE